MTNDLEIKLHQAVLPFDLKGRVCKPAVSLSDKDFTYTPSIKTNLAETFKRAMAGIGERTKEKVAA